MPNEIARQDYIKKLAQQLDLRAFDLGRLFQYPTDEIVRSLFQSIVDKIDTAHDDYFSEGALQGTLEAWLRAMLQLSPRYKLVIQGKHDLNDDPPGYSDLMLIDPSSKIAVLFELERIRVKYILDPRDKEKKKAHVYSH